jgi:hypothetical protein
VAALEAALPAAIIAAVATTPGGLTTAAQVFVGRTTRRSGKSDPEAFIRPVDALPEAPALGTGRTAYTYHLTFESEAAADDQFKRWTEQARRAFHLKKLPAAITGLRYTEVAAVTIDVHQQEMPTRAASVMLIFHGED